MKVKYLSLILGTCLLASCGPSTTTSQTTNNSSQTTTSTTTNTSNTTSTTTSNTTTSITTTTSVNEKPSKLSIEDVMVKLDDSYDIEINQYNNAKLYTITNSGDLLKEVRNEEWTRYQDDTTGITGDLSYVVKDASTLEVDATYTDTLDGIITSKRYTEGNQSADIFYYIYDYAKDGKERQPWSDDANRLPIVDSGSASEDGVSYLLRSSLNGQLSLQSSLRISQFLSTNLVNNVDLTGVTLPEFEIQYTDDVVIYTLEDFAYEASSDGLIQEYSYDVSFTLEFKTNKFISGSTTLRLSEYYEDEKDDVYVSEVINNYEVNYGDRSNSSSNPDLINPEDYFLAEVTQVAAYYYDNGNKVYVENNAIPFGKFVRFEALEYKPAKAVDIEMEVVNSSNSEVAEVSDGTAYIVGLGEVSLDLESLTGVTFKTTINIPPVVLNEIVYVDLYSGVEIEDNGDAGVTRTIYANTTYTNINIYARPEGADVTLIDYRVDKEGLIELTTIETNVNKFHKELQLKVVGEITEPTEVTVTFFNKEDESVNYSVTYTIKNKYSVEEMQEFLSTHKFEHDYLFDPSQVWRLSFTKTTGHVDIIKQSNDTEEILGSIDFNYTYDGNGTLNVTYTGEDNWEELPLVKITLDGTKIVFSTEDEFTTTRTYLLVNEA